MYKLLLSAMAIVVVAVSSGCGAPDTAAPPTTVLPTVAPTATPTPPPASTDTPEPSPTPIGYPDVLNQTFTGVNVLYRDDFRYRIQGLSPDGWVAGNDAVTLRKIQGGWFKITPRPDSNGDVFYYTGRPLQAGEGVYMA